MKNKYISTILIILFVSLTLYSQDKNNLIDFNIDQKKSITLSLLFSHGSGLYLLNENDKALPYLLLNIFLVDIPILFLSTEIILNKTNPDIFQGDFLAASEYISNSLVFTIPIFVLLIRYFEYKEIKKIIEN